MWLGQINYSVALEVQQQAILQVQKDPSQKIIFGLEHPSVITLGRQAKEAEDILVSLESLESLGVQYYRVERGGHATLHNPGQLVVYPILDLNYFNLSVRKYVDILIQSTKFFLNDLGIETFCKKEIPGLYTKKGKIAFFGVRISRGVTSHGVSINIKNNLEEFSLIKSCGLANESFDQVGSNQSLEELFFRYQKVFNLNLDKTLKSDLKNLR